MPSLAANGSQLGSFKAAPVGGEQLAARASTPSRLRRCSAQASSPPPSRLALASPPQCVASLPAAARAPPPRTRGRKSSGASCREPHTRRLRPAIHWPALPPVSGRARAAWRPPALMHTTRREARGEWVGSMADGHRRRTDSGAICIRDSYCRLHLGHVFSMQR